MRVEPTMAERGGGINWGISLFMLGMHLGGVAALFYFSWSGLAIAVFLMWVGGSLGIGMGYHRLLTHRGYKVSKTVERFLTTCGSLALEGGPIAWVATHRVHHAYAERDGDPHSPRHGIWWSHMGWLLTGKSLHFNTDVTSKYCPDLARILPRLAHSLAFCSQRRHWHSTLFDRWLAMYSGNLPPNLRLVACHLVCQFRLPYLGPPEVRYERRFTQ